MSRINGTPDPVQPLVSRRTAVGAILLLSGFVGLKIPTLWDEWQALRGEWAAARRSAGVGYIDIHPNISGARKPVDWIHDEGDSTLLWSGWTPGVGHGWFRVGRGELDPSRLSNVFSRDAIRAIDVPIVELGGGERWDRIPPDAAVVGLDFEGSPTVYPMLLLQKVAVVNDRILSRPLLVAYSPFQDPRHSVDVYDPRLNGRRVTMGVTGYLQDRKLVLYDRDTESLWVATPRGLDAIAGPHKGARLRRIALPIPVRWEDWKAKHPESRLVVGAWRPHGRSTH